MNNLQQAIVVGSMIGSIMKEYNPYTAKERKKPINEIKRVIKRMMFSRSRSNPKDFEISVKIGHAVWNETVDRFKTEKMAIDAVAIVARLYDLYEAPLSKFAQLTPKRIDAFTFGSDGKKDIEFQSYEVADYMIERLSEYTGVKRLWTAKNKDQIEAWRNKH